MENILNRSEEDGAGVVFFKARRFVDSRGWILNANASDFTELETESYIHSFIAHSKRHTLRGFHFQDQPAAQAKIIHVINGEIIDVSFRLSDPKTPPTLFKARLGDGCSCDTAILSDEMAHAYFVLSETATLLYLNSKPYLPQFAQSLDPLDPNLGCDWGIPLDALVISERDRAGLSLINYRKRKNNV